MDETEKAFNEYLQNGTDVLSHLDCWRAGAAWRAERDAVIASDTTMSCDAACHEYAAAAIRADAKEEQ